MKKTLLATLAAGLFCLEGGAEAVVISPQGSVAALTNVSQITEPTVGMANFDGFNSSLEVPLDMFSGSGMTFRVGPLTSFLAGVTTPGTSINPVIEPFELCHISSVQFFPSIGGGGTANSSCLAHTAVLTFSAQMTQFGLTFSNNGRQYITAWDTSGSIIGHVSYLPVDVPGIGPSLSSFVGIDTLGVPIAMLAVGNDDLVNGAEFSNGGSTTRTDSWIWAGTGELLPLPVPEPTTLAILGLGLAGLGFARRRKAA